MSFIMRVPLIGIESNNNQYLKNIYEIIFKLQ